MVEIDHDLYRDHCVEAALIIYGDRDTAKPALHLPPPTTSDPNGHVHPCNTVRMAALVRNSDDTGCVCEIVRAKLEP